MLVDCNCAKCDAECRCSVDDNIMLCGKCDEEIEQLMTFFAAKIHDHKEFHEALKKIVREIIAESKK